MSTNHSLSRRGFLRLSALWASATLAACAPKVVEKVVKETVIIEKPIEKEITKIVKEVVKETVIVAGTPKVVEKEVTKIVEKVVTVVPEAPVGPVVLNFWVPWGIDKGGGGNALGDVKRAWEEKQSKATIEYTVIPGKWRLKEKRMIAIAAGTMPDLMLTWPEDIPELGERGVLVPLDDFIKADNYDLSQFYPFVTEMVGYKGYQFAMIHHPDVRGLFRHSRLFEEAGLDSKPMPPDWDTLREYGAKTTKVTGDKLEVIGLWPTWRHWAYFWMQANNVPMLGARGRKAVFNTPGALEALKWVHRFVDQVMGGFSLVRSYSETLKLGEMPLFANSKIGMIYCGNWICWNISQVDAEMPWEVSPMPGGPAAKGEKFSAGGGTMVSILKGTGKAREAWEHLAYLGSLEGQLLIQKRTEDLPGRKDAAHDPQSVKEHYAREKTVSLLEEAKQLMYVPTPVWSQMNDEFVRLGDAVLLGDQPEEEVLANAQTAVQRALDDFWTGR